MISPAPTYARVASLSQWSSLFSPQGAFRAPSDQGNTIEHLDLDIRFVPSSYEDIKQGEGIGPLVLPNVCILTLRGGEYCQDSDERMELLLEVLENVRPVEVRWLNAAQEANEQRTYSTVCVHPVIIAAGQRWAAEGVLRKLMVQGGFPCPNLSAPTPFSLTPATTPCPSPGPTRATFGSFTGLSGLSSLPALSTTKPKVIDEAKAHERAERKRLAEYSLKPRFDFAFASWGVEILEWSFEGRFTPTGIHTILSYLFKSLNKFLNDYPLPSLAIISPIPDAIIQDLVHLPEILDMSPEAQDWLHDAVILLTSSKQVHRPFVASTPDTRERVAARLKACLLSGGLIPADFEHAVEEDDDDMEVNDHVMVGEEKGITDGVDIRGSPVSSVGSLPPMGTSTSDEEEDRDMATTPDLGTSIIYGIMGTRKGQVLTRSGSESETSEVRL